MRRDQSQQARPVGDQGAMEGLFLPDFEAAWERRFEVPVSSLKIPVASIDDLIQTKRGTGRKQDEYDIGALELVKRLVSEKESE